MRSEKLGRRTDNLRSAKDAKRDEFYTQRSDIDLELAHYEDHFRGKVVFCNCDRPESHFVKYFIDNYERLGLRGLEYESTDFRGDASLWKHRRADVIVTNPPCSLFRAYIDQMLDEGKQFLVIGNLNALSCRDFFGYIWAGALWLGSGKVGDCVFEIPREYPPIGNAWVEGGRQWVKLSVIRWYTNLPHSNHPRPPLVLTESYDPDRYPVYDNWDARDCSKVADIPADYDGILGVPITFIEKWCPNQFEILGSSGNAGMGLERNKIYSDYTALNEDGSINKRKWRRLHDHPFLEGPPRRGVRYVHKYTGHTLRALYKRVFIRKVK